MIGTTTRRKANERLVLAALRHHGPMCDDQLAWWLSHFGVKQDAVARIRRRLTKQGQVRFARKFTKTSKDRWAQMWEVAVKQ